MEDDDVEIIEEQGKPTVIRITGNSLRNTGREEYAGPSPVAHSKKIEMGNLIREKINKLSPKNRLQAYGEIGSRFGIGADNVKDLAARINQRLDSADFKDVHKLASEIGINTKKFADKPKEIVDDQGNVMGYRKGMSSEKKLAGPRNVEEQKIQMKNQLVKERRSLQLKTEISKDLDLEEIERLQSNSKDEGIFGFMKMFQKKEEKAGAATNFLSALSDTSNKSNVSEEVEKVEIPETGDTISFPKQIGKYTVRAK